MSRELTYQEIKCLRGEHEPAEGESTQRIHLFTREDREGVDRECCESVLICKHCRCLYAEKR